MNWKSSQWHTEWQGPNLVVERDDVEIDRIHVPDVRRVIIVYQGDGASPSDVSYAIVELADEHVVFPAESGIAGRVNFERQAFWAERGCIWWVSEAKAGVPPRLRRSAWRFGRSRPGYMRLPKAELGSLIDSWPLEGPQTWEERKWQRIERSRPFATVERVCSAQARRSLVHSKRPSRSHFVATHFSPSTTGAPPCSVRVIGCGRS